MNTIQVTVEVKKDIKTVWNCWVEPSHITQWAFASDTWEAPYAENDVRSGGRFLTRMSAKDGSTSFDFSGTYTNVTPLQKIEYTMDDGRTASITFEVVGEDTTKIIETFEMEDLNSEELQRNGWQAILDNFKKHTEKEV